MALRLFYSCSGEDDASLSEFVKHLSPLQRAGLIETFSDRDLPAGAERQVQIDGAFQRAEVFLFLISADFFASAECRELVQRALARLRAGTATIVPVLVRPMELKGSGLDDLVVLPRGGKPIKSWRDQDQAWQNVATGVRAIVDQAPRRQPEGGSAAQSPPPSPPPSPPQPLIAPEPEALLAAMMQLLPAQFETLLFHIRIPLSYISGPTAPQASRAIEVVRYAEQPSGPGLPALAALLSRAFKR